MTRRDIRKHAHIRMLLCRFMQTVCEEELDCPERGHLDSEVYSSPLEGCATTPHRRYADLKPCGQGPQAAAWHTIDHNIWNEVSHTCNHCPQGGRLSSRGQFHRCIIVRLQIPSICSAYVFTSSNENTYALSFLKEMLPHFLGTGAVIIAVRSTTCYRGENGRRVLE